MKLNQIKRSKIIVPAVIVILVIGSVASFVLWASKPHQGRVTNASSSRETVAYQDKLLEGTYFQFVHSSNYSIKKEAALNGEIERYTLSAGTRYDKRLLAAITNLPDGQIDSYGAYIYRKSSADVYSMRKIQSGSNTYNVWVRKDGTEQTAMIQRGNKLALITLVTANPKDDLTTEMDALLNTFKWK